MQKSQQGKKEVRAFIPLELWEMAKQATQDDWHIQSFTHFVQMAIAEKVARMQAKERSDA